MPPTVLFQWVWQSVQEWVWFPWGGACRPRAGGESPVRGAGLDATRPHSAGCVGGVKGGGREGEQRRESHWNSYLHHHSRLAAADGE